MLNILLFLFLAGKSLIKGGDMEKENIIILDHGIDIKEMAQPRGCCTTTMAPIRA
jgi:hypothetical protein